MDISSTTSQVSASAETTTSTQTQKTSSKGDSSFKDEMSKVSDNNDTKSEAKDETKAEVKTEATQNYGAKDDTSVTQDVSDMIEQSQKAEMDIIKGSVEKRYEQASDLSDMVLLSGDIGFQNNNPNIQAQVLIDANVMLSEIVSDAKTPVKVDYTSVQMDMNDTQFFTELVQDTDKTIQNVVTELTQNPEADVQEIQKNIKVSATLMNALSEAVKNKQSFRIDFDKDISVIIKVDRDGSLTARFIPGDNAVEQYLKQNMSSLRQRFDEQELPYKELSYTGQQKRERKENQNNKENGHE